MNSNVNVKGNKAGDEDVGYPPLHQDLSPHSSANLIELTITFPSPWYLIACSGTDPSAVPQELLQMYVMQAIADKRRKGGIQASGRGVTTTMMTGSDDNNNTENKEEDNTPHTSAWRMAGDVLRLVAGTLDGMRAVGGGKSSSSHPQGAEAVFCLYTSNRFRLTWRPLDSMPATMGVRPTQTNTREPAPANTLRDDDAATSAKHADDIAVLESLIVDRDGRIAALEHSLQGREDGIRGRRKVIQELEDIVAQRDGQIALLDRQLRGRDEEKGQLGKALREVEVLRAKLRHVEVQAQLDHNRNNKDKESLGSNGDHDADDAKNSAAPASSSASPAAPTNHNNTADDELTVTTLQSELAAKDALIAQQATQIGHLRSIIRRLEYEAKTVDMLRKECEERALGAGEMPENRAKKEKFVEALVASDKRLQQGAENREGEVTESERLFSVY
ncbi:hypothetical protein ANO14919_145670 [Xylariales sp. No.14919]|nr:hypothetical protein ANO14919_145670 [Xylariales sp. No.14919]